MRGCVRVGLLLEGEEFALKGAEIDIERSGRRSPLRNSGGEEGVEVWWGLGGGAVADGGEEAARGVSEEGWPEGGEAKLSAFHNRGILNSFIRESSVLWCWFGGVASPVK